jgi:replicative DNA helicase
MTLELGSVDVTAPARRPQPHSLEAEKAVLGSILIAPARFAEVLPELQVDDFFLPAHREIFEEFIAIHRAEKPIDALLVIEGMRARDALRMLDGGETYLLDIANGVPFSDNVGHYVRIVRDRALQRRVLAAALEIAHQAVGDPGDVPEFLASSSAKLAEIAVRRGGGAKFRPFREDLAEAMAEIEKRSSSGGRILGIRTGIWELDKVLMGLQRECVYIVAARPGLGKTSLAINAAVRHAKIAQNHRSLIFSLEMSRLQLIDRILAQEAPLDHSNVRSGNITPEGWRDLAAAEGRLANIGVTIDDESVTPDAIEARANAFRAKYPDDEVLIVIDYLQLAQVERAKGESRADALGGFSGRIKRMAKRLKVPVIEVCQINRESEKEQRPPRNSDLRESGQIEQDADAIIFIYDKGVQLEEGGEFTNTEDGPVLLLVTKNRAGRQGSVKVRWVGRFCSFYDLETPTDSDGGYVAPAPPVDDSQRGFW